MDKKKLREIIAVFKESGLAKMEISETTGEENYSIRLESATAPAVPAAPAPAAPAVAPAAPAAPVPGTSAISPEIMAVIAASVAVVLRGKNFSITGVAPAAPKAPDIEQLMSLWSLEGRRQVYSSHSLQR